MTVCKRCGKHVKAVVPKYCGSCRKALKRERREAAKLKKAMKGRLK